MRSRGAAAAGLGRAKVAVQDTRHFRVNHVLGSEKEVEVLIETGQVQLRYIIVPGLVGTILTTAMVMQT